MRSYSTSRRRRGRRGARRRLSLTRDWAELPLDAISAIFHKLDHIDILVGPGQVCRSWRCAARDEPALWRRIEMRKHADLFNQLNLHGMAQAAVRRSKGQCEAFWGEYSANDDFLDYLGDQAPCLKSLRLISCYNVSTKRFAKVIEKFPLFEELEVKFSPNVRGHVFGVVGKACPQLKHFRLTKHLNSILEADGDNKDDEALGIATMHELHSLQLFSNNITNGGLIAILDNCQHLDNLDIGNCINVKFDDNLRARCARMLGVVKTSEDRGERASAPGDQNAAPGDNCIIQ